MDGMCIDSIRPVLSFSLLVKHGSVGEANARARWATLGNPPQDELVVFLSGSES